jgi:hypothetical protein
MLTENNNIFDGAAAEASKEPDTSDSSTENVETSTGQEGSVEEAPKDLDDKTPLHKDARFKRVIEERNRERAEKRELMERLERLEKERRPDAQKSTSSKPAWFAKFFGDDEEAWDGFQQMTASAKEQAKAEAIAELKREQETSSKESQKWQSWVNEQVESLEDEGETFDRNALFKVMDEYRPTDSEGNLDFKKGLELLKLKGSKPSNIAEKRKAGAMAPTSKSGSEPKKKDGLTSEDIRKMRAAEGW